MRRILTQTKNIILVFLLLSYGNVFAQTKTKYETAVISTGHASLSAEIIKNGTQFEVWIYNNHPTKTYKVDFSADVTFRGKKGEFVKTVTESLTLKPDGKGYDDYPTMGWADNSSNLYYSLIGGTFSNFDWSEVRDSNNSETSSNNASYSGSNNNTSTTNSRPPANASVQELSEWQRKQYGTQNNQQNTQPINNTASPQQTQTTNSNNGVTMADVQKILDENNRQSEQRLGVKSYANDAEMANDIVEGVSLVSDLITDIFKSKEKTPRQKELEQALENSRIEREVLTQEIENSKAVVAKFPTKEIPLSSEEKAERIYYFMYAYDYSDLFSLDLYRTGKYIYVSNVFEVSKNKDGKFISNTFLKSKMAPLTPHYEVLHGYYYTKEEAEQKRNELITTLQKNSVTIKDVKVNKEIAETTNQEEDDFQNYANEIAKKIDEWEYNEKIIIGGNYKELKKKYPEFYKTLKKWTKSEYQADLFAPKTVSKLKTGWSDNTITDYTIALTELPNKNEETVKYELNKIIENFKKTFGDNLIFDNNIRNSVNYYLYIVSPYSKYKIEISYNYYMGYFHLSKIKNDTYVKK